MPVIQSVLSRFGLARKETPIIDSRPSVTVTGGNGLGAANWTNRGDYAGLAKAGYQLNSDVYACISLIASAGKQVKWWDTGAKSKAITPREELYKAIAREGEGDEAPAGAGARWALETIERGGPLMAAPGQPAKDAMKDREQKLQAMNPRASLELLARAGGESFIEAWLSYILISGNNYIEIERKGHAETGTPSMLYLQRPDRVKAVVRAPGNVAPQLSESQLVDKWIITAYGRERDVPSPNITHSKLFNPSDDIYGMAPLQAALLRVDAENEGLTLIKRMLQRGFAPGWIEAREDSQWGDTQVAALKERIKFSKTAGEELFLENAKWHQMGFTPVDSGVTEQQILSKRDIASVFHVPSQLIGDAQTQTYSNYQEARRALYMEAVIPLLQQFRGDWNRTIGKALNSPLDFDKDSFDAITAARQEATDRVVKLFTSGLITQAEGRSDLEYGPAQPGDVFYAPANLMPLGEKVE